MSNTREARHCHHGHNRLDRLFDRHPRRSPAHQLRQEPATRVYPTYGMLWRLCTSMPPMGAVDRHPRHITNRAALAALYNATNGSSWQDNTNRAALAALYNATNGSSWQDNTNWLSDRPLGEWYGVSTDADGRVTQLLLGGNELSGTIPPELGNLAYLQRLELRDNQFSGCVPVKLLDMTSNDVASLGLPFC